MLGPRGGGFDGGHPAARFVEVLVDQSGDGHDRDDAIGWVPVEAGSWSEPFELVELVAHLGGIGPTEGDEHLADDQLRRKGDVVSHQGGRPFVPAAGLVQPTDEAECDRVAQDPRRVFLDEFLGELPQPDRSLSNSSGPVQVPHRRHDEPERGLGVAGGQVMADSRGHVAGGLLRRRGSAMQRRQVVCSAQLQLADDEVAEELVEANCSPLGVERHQGKATAEQSAQQLVAVRRSGHRGATPPVDVAQQGQRQHRVALLGRKSIEHLSDDVIEQHPVGSDDLAQEAARVGAVLQRQPGQLQSRRPALGPGDQELGVAFAQHEAIHAIEQVSRLRARQSERRLADLREQASHAPAGEGQVGITPRDQDRPEPGWGSLQEERQLVQGGVVGEQVDVIEDQHHVRSLLAELGEQRRDDVEALRAPLVERQDRFVTQGGDGCPERCRDVSPEALRRSVVGVDGQPGHRSGGTLAPLGDGHRLPVARWSDDQA